MKTIPIEKPLEDKIRAFIKDCTTRELQVPIGASSVAKIPFPMHEDDFDLLLATLSLWKASLTKKPEEIEEEKGPKNV